MRDVIEIVVAMLAAVGLARLFELLAEVLLYPRRVRRAVSLIFDECSDASKTEAQSYAAYLYKNGKISSKRLIIRSSCGIIKENLPPEGGEMREFCDK